MNDDTYMIPVRDKIRPSRRLDQHFLIDDRVAERQVGYADITSSDVVLEIGAGSGKLTEKLEKMAGKVYAIEKDRS
ncbi:MAG: rRNA adenine N-6-methyltransferase family protein, partial [Halobacteriota archaeon]|nr:rRNA adenine N-6-methyltransferase family protein [Halobacteriota archaeon]